MHTENPTSEEETSASAPPAFLALLMRELLRSIANDFDVENHDKERERFGPKQPRSLKNRILRAGVNKISGGKLAVIPTEEIENQAAKIFRLYDVIQKISFLHNLLTDTYSKNLLVSLLSFRILGWRKIKLPTNNPSYWNNKVLADSLAKNQDSLEAKFTKLKLSHFDLSQIGWPITLNYNANGILKTFLLKQYEYKHLDPTISAAAGDVVIDAGGCWGDTALYFAKMVGPNGQVHTFEFLPSNLEILNSNLKLNPLLASRISVVPKALFNISGKKLVFQENGPGTKLSEDHLESGASTAITTSIDDYVQENKISRIGFIKMDIEGAELSALQGAINTIKRDRPRLAIAIYHDLNDFITIPQFLSSLNLGYSFYIDHFTIHDEETILFAKPDAAEHAP